MPNNRKILISAGAGAAIVIGIIFYFLLGNESKPARAPFLEPGSAEWNRSYSDSAIQMPTKQEVLKAWKEWARFPPDSRPLDEQALDQIDHGVIFSPYAQMAYPVDGKVETSQYACQLQPLTHTVTEGMQMLITLRCVRSSAIKPVGVDVPIRVINYSLKKMTPAGPVLLPASVINVGDDGQNGDAVAGDHIYTFAYRPVASDWGDMQFQARWAIPEEEQEVRTKREYERLSSFFSSPVAPARFTGTVTEEIIDGSLQLNAEVVVHKPGRYRIYGNLRNADGYIAIAKNDLKLAAGTQMIPLQFFGKILHDAEADGPYTLTGLRGYRDTFFIDADVLSGPPAEVDAYLKKMQAQLVQGQVTDAPREVMPNATKDFQTRAHDYSEFSDREWDSPEKSQRLHEIEDQGGFQ
ncbi:MAG: hypothetical protein K8S54_18705 [Spirochaetia bacterium]|nr:hypothetical protein [Spirochaetia bacterium]